MNPRIYKKQAKRAVELMRSHGHSVDGYEPTDVGGVEDPPGGWRRAYRERGARQAWDRIQGIPEFWQRWGWDGDWDGGDARNHWMMMECYGGMKWGTDGNLIPAPKLSHYQRRGWISTKAIAPGWRWRGGRAVRRAGGAP